MSEQSKDNGDGLADGIAATAIVTIVVAFMYFWLSSMPA
jgi:hypothetical protein